MKEPRAPRVERSQHLPSATNDCQAPIIERFNLDGNRDLEGAEARRLIRVNEVTIRELARRMRITMKRIREVREIGLDDRYSIRDWLEAITGVDRGEL